jgi:hypothetical protein
MLTQQDLNQIGKLFDEKFDQKFDQKFDEKFDQKFDEKFDQKFDEKFAKMAQEIIGAVNVIIDPLAENVFTIKKDIRGIKKALNYTNIRISSISEEYNIARKRIDRL